MRVGAVCDGSIGMLELIPERRQVFNRLGADLGHDTVASAPERAHYLIRATPRPLPRVIEGGSGRGVIKAKLHSQA